MSKSPDDTMRMGKELGKLLLPGDVIALEGDLGAGKTMLTKGIASGLGIPDRITSPTFTLINEYHLESRSFFHVDCYRLGAKASSTAEAISIGLVEILSEENIVVIEWAEKVKPLLPASHLWIEMHHEGENSRRITVQGKGARGVKLAMRWLKALEAGR